MARAPLPWETEFPQLKPVKSSTGQRMYRRKDVESVLRIKQLLYEKITTKNPSQRTQHNRKSRSKSIHAKEAYAEGGDKKWKDGFLKMRHVIKMW